VFSPWRASRSILGYRRDVVVAASGVDGVMGAAQNAKRSPESGDLSLQLVMVAGQDAVNTDRALRGASLISCALWEP
jgi:hypothetical protein